MILCSIMDRTSFHHMSTPREDDTDQVCTYPLSTIHLDVDEVQVEVTAAISRTFPIGTDVPQLAKLFHPSPQSEAFVVTTVHAKGGCTSGG